MHVPHSFPSHWLPQIGAESEFASSNHNDGAWEYCKREVFSKASGHKTKNAYLMFLLLESVSPKCQGRYIVSCPYQ
jgi:hypothetical protein